MLGDRLEAGLTATTFVDELGMVSGCVWVIRTCAGPVSGRCECGERVIRSRDSYLFEFAGHVSEMVIDEAESCQSGGESGHDEEQD